MSYTFQEALRAFKNDHIRELSLDSDGRRFLKLRSLSRNTLMDRLIHDHHLTIPEVSGQNIFQLLYESPLNEQQIEQTIRSIYEEEREARRASESQLISELYRVASFDWGGLHQNSLEKTIVDNYVKKIKSYNELCENIDNRLYPSMKSYVLCSWYNHWTSMIIEDIFKDHPHVLPAVGLIKKIDFFIKNVPFDLKVTYLPEGFIKEYRREHHLRPELTLLKQFCRTQKLYFSQDLADVRLLEDLWSKVRDHPSGAARELMTQLKNTRMQILQSVRDNPETLIRWLYENQGVRRFDASNRLFLVLVDEHDFFSSWKLKRAKPLLAHEIHQYLDQITDRPGRDISFDWDGKAYATTADMILISH
ncbi:hypothetical protein U14_05869 [Candidatus Moduliflexus flocculans]|uniref:Uncharacterized protein n=1 Tax=Candidatus Moduliflexus flocculans TaxID=1499966 RepID=A0A081BT51_9BACT|nr:hypothetical protein U14_05869 [Candidatus Moduliflexus flocculans]